WHQDNLTTVPDTGRVSPGFATNISGSGSAWCGLRACGDLNAPVDSYTGNRYTADDETGDFPGPASLRSARPGYAGQWDQLMYRDFTYTGAGTISFDYRAELNNAPTGDPGVSPNNGGGWFTPDPFSSSNLVCKATSASVAEPVDSFEVWIGAPKETGVYDSAHRYLSDTIDFGVAGARAPPTVLRNTGRGGGNSGALSIPAAPALATVPL